MSQERISRHLRIRGRVQGVGFRWFVQDRAREHGVDGWVRNGRDGSVEAMIQGTASAVDLLLASVRRGPGGSRVDSVAVSETASTEVFEGFEIRP